MADQKTILLVEDDAILAMSEAMILRRQGYNVIISASGQDAIAKVNQDPKKIDLILMDINLGEGMDGTQAAQEILKIHDIPVVFLSSHTEPEVVAKTEKITSYGYVVKSSSPTVLFASIKMAFKLYDAHQALQLANNRLEQEIAERKQAQDALFVSRSRAQAMLNAIPDLMFRLDSQGVFLDYKANIDDLYAQSEPTIIGKRNRDISPPEFADLIERQTRITLQTGITQLFEYQLDIPGRGVRSYEARMSPSGSDEVIAIVRDITARRLTEAALNQSTDKLLNLADSIPGNLAFIHAESLQYEFVNAAFERTVGMPREKILGGYVKEIIGAANYEVAQKYIQEVKAGKAVSYQGAFETALGNRWLAVNCVPMFAEDGRVESIIVFGYDFTEMKQVGETFRKRSQQLHLILAHSPLVLAEIDMNGRHTLLEGKGLELLGQDPKVLTQASVYEVFQNRPEILGYIQQAMQGDLVTATTEYAGQLVEVHFEPIWAENHVVEGVVAVANVITDVKKVQAKLLKSEENLRKVLDILPVGVWIADKDGKITHSNPAGRQTWSGARYVGPDEFHEYKAWWMPSRKPVQPDEWGIARAVTRGETSLEEELEIECFDGTHKIILNWASPILGPNHEIVGAVAVNQDITARKQAEEMLVAREKRFRALIESSSDAISLLDDRGKVLYESPSYTRIMGYREEERIGRDSFDLVHPEDYHRTAQMFAELLEHPGRVAIQPTRVKHGDGSWHWIEGVANNLLSEPAVRAIVINFRDITERKRAETALLEWEAQLETVTQNTPDTILQVDSGGIIRFINRAASGFAIEDVIGTSIYEWVPDEQHAILAQTLDAVFSTGGHGEYETPGRGQGAEERFYHVRVMPVTVGGKTISAIYTATDITARKKTEEELRRSIQEKEMLMHELQHRVKNSLAIAASLLGLEEANLADEKARAIFASAQLRLSSMSAVYELLYKSGGIDKIELDEYIKNLVSGLSKSYITTAEAITIQTQLEKVQLDLKRALQLGLILNELITNALKYAFPAGASGTISIRLTESAGKVTLCVADNGVGLPDGELQHTGMGLELVGMLTEQINGEFTIQNHHGCTAQLVFGLE